MSKRLGVKEKRIKTLMEGAGLTRVEGKTCASHLKHLKEGAVIAAYQRGADYLWRSTNRHYEAMIEQMNNNPEEPVCFLFMLRDGSIVSLGDLLLCDVIRQWRADNG